MFDYKTEPAVLTLLQKQRVVCTSRFQFHNSFLESVTMAQLELLSTFNKYRMVSDHLHVFEEDMDFLTKGSLPKEYICALRVRKIPPFTVVNVVRLRG
jgi:hypothetical protein